MQFYHLTQKLYVVFDFLCHIEYLHKKNDVLFERINKRDVQLEPTTTEAKNLVQQFSSRSNFENESIYNVKLEQIKFNNSLTFEHNKFMMRLRNSSTYFYNVTRIIDSMLN